MNLKIMKRIFMFALVLATFAAGCSKPPEEAEKKVENLSPAKVVDQVFEAFKYKETENISVYFSKDISKESIDKFAEAVKSGMIIDKFRTRVSEENDQTQTAKVKVVYRYIDLKQIQGSNEKSPDSKAKEIAKNIGEKEFLLKNEDGFWKIRRTGFDKELDNVVDEKIFVKCLSEVLDITIAQEKYKIGKESYSQTLGLLDKAYIRESECGENEADCVERDSTCSEMKIERANRKGYLVSAESKTFMPCKIIATTECHAPKSFSECAGGKYLNDCIAEEDVPPVKLATPLMTAPLMATTTQPIPSKEDSSVTIAKISKAAPAKAKNVPGEKKPAAPAIAANSEKPPKENASTAEIKSVEKRAGTEKNPPAQNQSVPVNPGKQ